MNCIEVSTGKNGKGYGSTSVHIGGGQYYAILAHVVAYEAVHGPVRKGMVVMHTCDNRACVNPEHLRVGTQGDNIRDMHQKGRARNQNTGKKTCKRGHSDWASYVKGKRVCRECERARQRIDREEVA